MEEGSTPETVFAVLAATSPALAPLRPRLRCAVGDEYVEWTVALHDQAELAFIPPTAGG